MKYRRPSCKLGCDDITDYGPIIEAGAKHFNIPEDKVIILGDSYPARAKYVDENDPTSGVEWFYYHGMDIRTSETIKESTKRRELWEAAPLIRFIVVDGTKKWVWIPEILENQLPPKEAMVVFLFPETRIHYREWHVDFRNYLSAPDPLIWETDYEEKT